MRHAALLSSLMLAACTRDALPAAPDAAMATADLALAPFDVARIPCITAGQPADPVTGTVHGTPFTARVGLAGWSYGEGSCNGQPTIYLYQGRLPPGSEVEPLPELRIYDGASHFADLGARRDVDVTLAETVNVATRARGTVDWLRRDDYQMPGGVLEGNLLIDAPGWNLRGHFIANRCDQLDQVCL